ncbi:MAG: pantoate--beta-alanine ligase [Paludibacteraceae bacterium]|nr:pantoate--beta-alanine ligase [Candidatus Physcocola equi]MCQ2233251.1 pantoate--beta-alanine ligase [Paludibacteraceae bacterium]
MKVFDKIADVTAELDRLRAEGKTIGFVPTMGALHEGHLSLVKKCVAENDVCIVDAFVNPTQFNNKEDYEKYPRTVDADAKLLEGAGANLVWFPTESDIYPEPDTRVFELGPLAEVMEGKYRPGHFNGVAQVLTRLFSIVKPDRAYFGEKDFQQLAIVREMVKHYNIPVQIVGCPIVREADGLALSSRNMRLSAEQRQHALRISKTLFASLDKMKEMSVEEVKQWVIKEVNSEPGLEVEYFEISDSLTLQPVENWNNENIVGCITVYCGEVRLIDNIQYKKNI